MYTNNRMRAYSLDEALFLSKILNTLQGYYWCYPDDTEEEVMIHPSGDEIMDHYSNNVFLGKEEDYMGDPDDMTTEEFALIMNGSGLF